MFPNLISLKGEDNVRRKRGGVAAGGTWLSSQLTAWELEAGGCKFKAHLDNLMNS